MSYKVIVGFPVSNILSDIFFFVAACWILTVGSSEARHVIRRFKYLLIPNDITSYTPQIGCIVVARDGDS